MALHAESDSALHRRSWREILRSHRLLVRWLLPLAVIISAPLVACGPQPAELKPEQPIEKELQGAGSHRYRVEAGAGQYLRVVVLQKGIDVVVKLFGPKGDKLLEVDSPNGSKGPEPISYVTKVPGRYQVEVRSLEDKAPAGHYEIRLEALRTPTWQDSTQAEAECAEAEANLLSTGKNSGLWEVKKRAIEKYKVAVESWRKLPDRRAEEANTLSRIGDLYAPDPSPEPQQAIEYYNPALTIWQELSDDRRLARTLKGLCLAHQRFGENKPALDYCNRALPYWDKMNDGLEKASTLITIGVAYSELGQEYKAIEKYKEALSLLSAVKNLDKAKAHNNIGVAYFELGEMQKALEAFDQARSLTEELKDDQLKAAVLNNLGQVSVLSGDPKEDDYPEALEIYQRIPYEKGKAQTHNYWGNARWFSGNYQLASGSADQARAYQQAQEHYSQALALWRDLKNRKGEAEVLSNLGRLDYSQAKLQEALDHYTQAWQIVETLSDPIIKTVLLNNLGFVKGRMGMWRQARDHHAQALRLSREVGDRVSEARAYYGLALVERASGRLPQALSQSKNATRIVERLQKNLASPEMRLTYRASVRQYYELQVNLLMQLEKSKRSGKHAASALQVSELARARSLVESLGEKLSEIRQGVDPALLARERQLQQELNEASYNLFKLFIAPYTREQLTSARQKRDGLIAELQALQNQIRQSSPNFAKLTQPPLTAGEIKQQVRDKNTLLLEYALGEERSYLWAVTASSLNYYELPKRADIEAAAQRVYDLLKCGAGNKTAARPDSDGRTYFEAASALSHMLFGQVAGQLDKKLVIVPDGALHYIPFGALPDPAVPKGFENWQPLLVEHEIVNLPSASTLALLRRELTGRQPAPKSIILFADPVFEKDDERVNPGAGKSVGKTGQAAENLNRERALAQIGVNCGGRKCIPRLKHTRTEADGILALPAARDGLEMLDFQANRATATGLELGQFRIIHFATHAWTDGEHPELSTILLSLVDQQGQWQNGLLQAYEVYNFKLPAELVVLSACETGLGKLISGEALVSLTRGFMSAGTPRVVVSLWNVDDEATANLMTKFYREVLDKGMRPAAALRAAQVEMLKDQRWKAPYYWAAFTLQGEWR